MRKPVIYIDIAKLSSEATMPSKSNLLDDLGAFLSLSQIDKAHHFASNTRVMEFLGVRKLLRDLLIRYADHLHLGELRLEQDESGKPIITPVNHDLSVSLTHSRHWLGACFRYGLSVGMDLEERNRKMSDRLITRICTDEELHHPEFKADKLRLWVIKEAIVKSMGRGLQAHLHLVNICELNRIEWDSQTELIWGGCTFNVRKLAKEDQCFGFRAKYGHSDDYTGILLINKELILAVAHSVINNDKN